MAAKKKFKKRLIALLALISMYGTGCVSIRKAPERNVPSVSNCGLNVVREPGESCELYDRREVMHRWARQLNPIQLVPSEMSQWVLQQPDRCRAANASIQGWIYRKKAEANPPPWPRFHPVPTKPVFESDEDQSSSMPEIYGRFGKE